MLRISRFSLCSKKTCIIKVKIINKKELILYVIFIRISEKVYIVYFQVNYLLAIFRDLRDCHTSSTVFTYINLRTYVHSQDKLM